ncbi:MAG: S-methyl-5-thioribose-1-phosphate isomerase [Elusimicrobia bacterium]|nr:S-methyl-5-thioribose-1-phosphate isomerase [Elusimicrobiota bacterium]
MPKKPGFDSIRPVYWKNGALYALDQRLLPHRLIYRRLASAAAVAAAIRDMLLRGAPLIGVAAAYGCALAAKGGGPAPSLRRRLREAGRRLLDSRPTAVNLAHAVRRMERKAEELLGPGRKDLFEALVQEAHAVFAEDLDSNRRMAEAGARLLKPGSSLMTHCNAGALATSGIGTALGVVRWAYRLGKIRQAYVCETRPYLQGSRLTLWELMKEGIPATLITDNMAAHIMATERVDAVLVGADRIAANADAANKIGTYGLAISARHHGVPFYVVAPSTTVDFSLPDGARIPIEERSVREVVEVFGRSIAPRGARARHPAFDVTPHRLITAIVTEKGVVKPACGARLRAVVCT